MCGRGKDRGRDRDKERGRGGAGGGTGAGVRSGQAFLIHQVCPLAPRPPPNPPPPSAQHMCPKGLALGVFLINLSDTFGFE